MSKDIPTDLREAVDIYQGGLKPQAFLKLKLSRGISPREAEELILDALNSIQKGDGVTADQDAAMKQALDAVNTFDELTVMVMRQMRDTKQGISVGKLDADNVLHLCATIYNAMRNLIAADVNPTRAMTTFLTECCKYVVDKKTGAMNETQPIPTEDYAASLECMKKASAVSLKDDLLTLL